MLTVKSEEASPPNFTKHNLITLVDVLSETILGDEWLISGDIPMEVERSLRTLLSHLKSDLHAFTEHLFSDERVYGTALQLKEQITQAPVVLRFIKCLSRIMLGVDIKATSFILVLDIFRIWTSDRVAATFMSNPEIGIVDLFMQLALTSQDNDRLLHCLCEITKLSRVKNFTYRINKKLLGQISDRILTRDKDSLLIHLSFLSNICDNKLNCRDLQNLPNFDALIRYLVGLLGQNEVDYIILVKALMVIAELTENLSIGGNFFTEGNIVETTKMIFSVLTKASSRRDMDGSIELLEQLCKSDSLKEVINRYLKSSKPIKAALKSLSAEGSTQDQGFRLFTVLLKNRLCEEQLLPLISDTILLSDAAAWLETVVSSSQSLGQQYIDCEHAIQVVVAIMNSGLLKKLEKSKKSLTEHIYKFSSSLLKSLESLLSSDDILSKLGYLLSFAVEVAEALNLVASYLCTTSDSSFANLLQRCRRIFDRLIKHTVEDNCLPWLLVPLFKIIIESHGSNMESLKREGILSDKLHRSVQICLGTSPYSSLVEAAVEITRMVPSEFPLPMFIAQENRFRLFQTYSKFLTEATQKTSKRRDFSLGRPSSSFGIDFHVLDGLSSFRAERPADYSFMKVEDADRSINALSQLEKEVEFMEHRMRKEMELKTAISQQKVSAYELKISSLKSELGEARDALEQKTEILSRKNSEINEKNSEFTRTLSTFERENEVIKQECESMKKELRAEAEKNKTWEGQVAKLQSSVSALQTKLSEKDASMASTKSTIEELTATLSATRIEKENMVQMLRARLEAAQESVKKHEKENASLKELFASRDTRVNELEKKVRDMEDESKIQEDIVSKLAESLNGLSMRRKK